MDYKNLRYFYLNYGNLSDYYKNELNSFLDKSFNLPSYELYNNTIIYGFLYNNKIIGTLSLLKTNDLEEVLNKHNNNEMIGYSKKGKGGLFIYNIVIKEEFKRKKLAEVLIHLCLKNNINEKYLHCQVKKDNEPSFNLFFKCGFQIEDELLDNDGNNVCVMSRDI